MISDLAEVVNERATFWGFLAEDQDRAWKLDVQDGAYPVVGSTADLAAMLDALLGNVFQHTPPGTDYRVSLRRAPGGMAELTVADDGPGIEDPALLERGSSGAESTGLGADIVSRTAEAAGGSAAWSSEGSVGTVVRIAIPISAFAPLEFSEPEVFLTTGGGPDKQRKPILLATSLDKGDIDVQQEDHRHRRDSRGTSGDRGRGGIWRHHGDQHYVNTDQLAPTVPRHRQASRPTLPLVPSCTRSAKPAPSP